jgi:hypothetical protein
VNQHLQYTHGEGLVLAQANAATSGGNPSFAVQNVPPRSSSGFPAITQPDVYFGENLPGYVIANTQQPELDYQKGNSGTNVETHYKSTGGVQINSVLTKAAFFVRFGDFNLLVSNLITDKSRMIFVRDVQQMAQKAAPFLSFDADPYAAVVDGHIDWILDAYTTTSMYPYSQNASSAQTPPGSGLPSSYNYVRNSVKVVIDAYSGKMTFYDMTTPATPDPILQAYEAAFPHMFTPASEMSSALQAHLRYPEDLFSIQAAVYGRYHITNAEQFYTAGTTGGDAWSLSPTAGVGSPANALAVTTVTNAQGQIIGTPPVRMSPLYQVLAQPGQDQQKFSISDAYVPASAGNQVQNLSAFMESFNGTGQPGQLVVYVTPQNQSVTGPALADSKIQQSKSVSSQISLLDQHGSDVELGNILMIPIDQSILYVRPLYVVSSGNPQPQLQDVIAVFGQKVDMESTLSAALTDVLNTQVNAPSSSGGSNSTGPGSSSVSAQVQAQVQSDLTQALNDYNAAQTALASGQPNALATYESDIEQMDQEIAAAQNLLPGASIPSGSTTTTTPAKRSTKSTTTTTTKPSSSSESSTTAKNEA